MSTEGKQDFQIYHDSDYIKYPKDEKQVSDFIKHFYKSNVTIELRGSGSKKEVGKQVQCSKVLNLSKISGILEYLPEELYIKVKACTPMNEIEEILKKNKQHLAFEPIDFGYLFSGKSNYGTAAGLISTNISGPRRFKVGSVRDHVLGFRGVNGKGEIIKSGGIVVKNVTGYDLSKLVSGSYGTLVALTEITLKVLPLPEESKTLIIHELKMEEAISALNKTVSSSNDPSGAIFLPPDTIIDGCTMNVEKTFKLNDLKYGGSLTAIRIEGSKNSIDERIKNLSMELNFIYNNFSVLETHQSDIFWKKVKNLEAFSSTPNNIIRIVVPPSQTIQLVYLLSSLKCKYYIDWGGSLIWAEIFQLTKEIFESLRNRVVKNGGYMSMIKFSDYLPHVEEMFVIKREKFFITQNVKKSFDPKKILNPGKMYTGI